MDAALSVTSFVARARELFAPATLGTDAHLDALDQLRAHGDVVEIDPGGARRTFVALSYGAVTEAARHPSLSSRYGTGLADVPEATSDGVPFEAIHMAGGAPHAELRARLASTLAHTAHAPALVPKGDVLAWVRALQTERMRPVFAVWGVVGPACERGIELAHAAAFAVHDGAPRDPASIDAELVAIAGGGRAPAPQRKGEDTDAWLVRFLFLTAFVTTELAAMELVCRAQHERHIDESLRVQSPVARFGRVALDDVTIAGVRIPRGARVVLSFAAANHDPLVFPRPRAINPARNGPAHVAFGAGAHACIGAIIATSTLRAVVEALEGVDVEVVERELLRSHVNRGARQCRVRVSQSR